MLDFEEIRKELEFKRKEKLLTKWSDMAGIDRNAAYRVSKGNDSVRFRTVKQISDYLEKKNPSIENADG